MERSIGLAFTTLTIFAPLARAAHPEQAVQPEGTAHPSEFVAPELPSGAITLDVIDVIDADRTQKMNMPDS